MKYRNLFVFLLFLVSVNTAFAAKPVKKVFGRAEEIILIDDEVTLSAKLDTGARSSSITAIDIEEFDEDDRPWVRFTISVPSEGIEIEKKLPVYRYANIKRRVDHNKKTMIRRPFRRPTVKMKVCLGDQVQEIEVNLADRSHFQFPMLLGRDTLRKFRGLVDVSKIFMIAPTCLEASNDEPELEND